MSRQAEILIHANNGREALAGLLSLRLDSPPKALTLAKIAKATSMPSRGYVADLISGRRKVTRRYQDDLLSYLKLEPFEKEVMTLLLEADRCRDVKTRTILRGQAKDYQKLLAATNIVVSGDAPPSPFACALFASFDFFDGKPTNLDLYNFFKDQTREHIDRALADLEAKKIIRKDGSRYLTCGDIVLMHDQSPAQHHVRFVGQAASEAAMQVATWFDRKQESCFQSFFLTVKKDAYIETLGEIKSYIYQKMSNLLETEEPDSLVQFNVHVFPHVLDFRQTTDRKTASAVKHSEHRSI